MINRLGQIILVNAQIESLFGYLRQELLGNPIEMLVPAAYRDNHPTFRQQFFAAPVARSMGVGRDLFGVHKDGSQIPLEIGLNPLSWEGEDFVVASVVDITERKRHEERLRLVVEAAPSGMIMVDSHGRIVLVNRHIEKLFAYNRTQLIGQPIEMLVPHTYKDGHPALRREFFSNPQARAMGTGRDLFGLRSDGSLVPLEIGLNPLIDQGAQYVLASIVDITQRKGSESLLREKMLELQRSNEDLQQFAYVCSHDLQEPLRVISNYTQLLAKRYSNAGLDENATDFIEFIVDATKRMQQLINDLLLYSRVDTRKQPFENVDTQQALRAAIANLGMAVSESGAKIEFDDLPIAQGDQSQITLLFQNLLANAIKFRSQQPPVIQVTAEDTLEDFWKFTIRDNGIGFDMKYAERIFVIFQRLHSKESYSGSGIGLSICKRIVERQGGKIWVESSIGGGAVFNFTIPKGSAAGGAA